MTEEKSENKSFTIRDRRFSSQENQASENTDATADMTGEAAQKPEKETPDKDPPDYTELPEISFMTFIMSLNASAMVHLGVIEDPVTGKKTKNLALGKQTIDILGMLEEKTQGNLNKDEENMLKNILYDLRIIYVKETS